MATHQTPPGGGENIPPTGHVPAAAKLELSRLERSLLADDSVAEFRLFRLGMHEDLRPRGAYQMRLVDRLAVNHWRMERCAIMEAETIAHRREYATAWANPRRVKTPPTAGAVWADDLQFHGGALEKLAKKEYRLSLEASRILRELAKRQKEREAEEAAGDADGFVERVEALRESAPRKPGARAGAIAGEPRNSRNDPEELRVGGQKAVNSAPSVPSADAMPIREATEPKPISANLQNELPPAEGEGRSDANSPTNEAKPIRREPRNSRNDAEELRVGGQKAVNSAPSVPSVDAMPIREATEPKPISANLQNEILPGSARENSPGSNSNPISQGANPPGRHSKPILGGANSPASETKPIAGEQQIPRIGADELPTSVQGQVNRSESVPSADAVRFRQSADPAPKAEILQNELPPRTWVGSGAET